MKTKILSIVTIVTIFSFGLRAMQGESENFSPEQQPALHGANFDTKDKGKQKKTKKRKSKKSRDKGAKFGQNPPYEPNKKSGKKKVAFKRPSTNLMDTFNGLTNMVQAGAKLPGRVGDWVQQQATRTVDNMLEQETIAANAEAQANIQLATEHITYNNTYIAAKENRKGQVRAAKASAQKWIDLIKKHPYLLVGIVGGASAGFFAAKNGMQVLFNEIQKVIGIPELAQDTSLLTWREKVARSLGLRKEIILSMNDLVYDQDFMGRITNLTTSLKNTVNNNGIFRNLLFHGVPGTGKTLVAKTMAQNSGLHYIYFAASGLAKLTEKDALNKVAELFDFAKRSSKKLMIIIDEAEVLFAHRNNSTLDAQMQKVLNLILTYTGTESKDYCLVVLTNRPEDIDVAVLSRLDEQIEFAAPTHEEIKTLLALYIKKLLIVPAVVKPIFYKRWFGKKISQPMLIESNAFDVIAIEEIARKIEGFTGRDISKLVIAFQSETFATEDMRLTKRLVDQIVDRRIAEKKKAAVNYKE